MSPDAKEALDYLVTLLGTGSVGGVLLALIGVWKATREKPHVAPTPEAVAPIGQIGGFVLTERQIADFTHALNRQAIAAEQANDMRERELEQAREQAQLQREHERRIASERHEDTRRLTDVIDTLANRVRNVSCAN